MRRLLLILLVLAGAAPAAAQTGVAARTLAAGTQPTPPDGSSIRFTDLLTSGAGCAVLLDAEGDGICRSLAKADLPAVVGYLDEAETWALLQTFTSGFTANAASTINGNLTIGGAADVILGTGGLRAGSGATLIRNVADSATIASFGDSAIALGQNTSVTGTFSASGAATLSSTLGVTGATTLSSTLGVTGATTLSSTLGVSGLTTAALIKTTGVYGVSEPFRVLATDGTTPRLEVANNGKATLTDTGTDSYLTFAATGNPSGQRNWRVGNIGGSLLLQGGNDAGSVWTSLFRTTQTAGVPDGWYWGTGMQTVSPDTNMGTDLGEIDKLYANLRVANLWANTLVAYDTITTIPGNVLVGPTTMLAADIDDDDTTIVVDHNEMVSGDIAYLQADGGTEFVQVTSGATGTGGGDSIVKKGQATGSNTATMPTHAAGDTIVVIALRIGSNTSPALGTGGSTFTNLCNGGADSTSYRVGYLTAASSAETVGTWTNATHTHVVVYEGVTGLGACATASMAASTTLRYPALTLTDADGSSYVLRAGITNQTSDTSATPPAGGYTLIQNQTGASRNSSTWHSDDGQTSVTQSDVTLGASGNTRGISIELLGTSTPVTGPYSYSVTRGYGGVFDARAWLKGAALFNTGTTGDCHLQMFAIQSIKGTGEAGPTIQGNCRTGTGYNAWSTSWVLGNLANMYSYGPTPIFGAAFGSASDVWVGIDNTNGFRAFEGGTNLKLQVHPSGYVQIGQAGSGQANTYVDNTNILMRMGTVNRMRLAASSLRFYDDSGSNYPVDLDGASAVLTLGYAHAGGTQPNIAIDGGNGTIALKAGSTTRLSLGASNGTLSIFDDDGSTSRVAITSTVARFGSASAGRIEYTYGGNLDLYDDDGDRRVRVNASELVLGKPGAATPYVQITDSTLSFCASGASCSITLDGASGDITAIGDLSIEGSATIGGSGSFVASGITMDTGGITATPASSGSFDAGKSYRFGFPAPHIGGLYGYTLSDDYEVGIETSGSGSSLTHYSRLVASNSSLAGGTAYVRVGGGTGVSGARAEIAVNATGVGSNSLVLDANALTIDGNTTVSATKTVRNSAGTGTCTLIFTFGFLTGGTC